MYYKSNLLFENKVIAKIYILQLMHSVSATDKDMTVIRIPYRHKENYSDSRKKNQEHNYCRYVVLLY